MKRSAKDNGLVAGLRGMVAALDDAELRERLQDALDGTDRAAPSPSADIRQEVLSGHQVAKVLGCTVRHVRYLAAEGLLSRAVLPGRSRGAGYLRAGVEALLRRSAGGAA